jgi:hypothetical protein
MTGEALGTLLRGAARREGVNIYAFIRPLTRNPHQWLGQLEEAQRPKPHTIARALALIAGEPMPEPNVKFTVWVSQSFAEKLHTIADDKGVHIGQIAADILTETLGGA